MTTKRSSLTQRLQPVKPEAKKQGPKAKNTVQDQDALPKPNPPQMDLFADF